jgi:sulfatase modifying factor 1
MSCKNVANENTADKTQTYNGGLIGTPTDPDHDTQGDVYSTKITISGTRYDYTGEVVIIPAGTTATIIGSDENWNSYYSGDITMYKGVFIAGRNVKLSPFVMSQYEVTQNLYTAVMGINPSNHSANVASYEMQIYRPVEKVTWYDAVAFCNELTKKTMTETDCVYTITDITKDDETGAIKSATVTSNITKKGYRLPTEAEWEYAARGGNPNVAAWKYAFAGIQAVNSQIYDGSSFIYSDDNLATVSWYSNNKGSAQTHQVGKKDANTLNLYDMSGNIAEWCWDWFNSDVTSNDSAYT